METRTTRFPAAFTVAAIAEASARRESEQARIRAEEEIAIAHRELALKQAEIKAQTDAAAAQAAASGPLAQAAKDQEVLTAQELVAARRAELKERELDTEVRKPADAQRYAVEQQAAAQKAREIAEAEAEAEQTRLSGAAERERRTALADAVRAEGDADAAAALARGQAEAEAMQRKAEAYAHYGDAAVIDILAQALPRVVAEAARPMGDIDTMTVISTDGASANVRSVASTVAQGQELAKNLLGIDIAELAQRYTATSTSATNGPQDGAVPPPPPPPVDRAVGAGSDDDTGSAPPGAHA